jgi:hypothetical protein
MPDPDFGELTYINIRGLWEVEPEFSDWLSRHLNVLGDEIDLELELIQTEAPVENFSADILAEDIATRSKVIIENQYGTSNHDHLGKMLTYSAGYDGYICVWIAEIFQEAHIKTLEWLNERTDSRTQFFAFEIKSFRIDDSRPVYQLQNIVKPNNWQREIQQAINTELSPTQAACKIYFQALIDDLRTQHNFTRARAGQPQSWYSFSCGARGFTYGMSFAQRDRVRVELYIDTGDSAKNKAIFDKLYQNRQTYENAYEQNFSWERLDNKRASRVALYRQGNIDSPRDVLDEIKRWSIENLLKFKQVFPPEILNTTRDQLNNDIL